MCTATIETTPAILQMALIVMANHQEVQKKVQAEIDSVITSDRLPSLDDKARLPYTEATIWETMRFEPIIHEYLPRATRYDTNIGGYFIPANTIVLVNQYACHMDSRVWREPRVFQPERFLNSDGKVIHKTEFHPFSMGARSCFGELLGKQMVFLAFTSLLQHFNILPASGENLVNYQKSDSIIISPKDYQLRLVPR
jgi:cytochrome P450